MEAGFSRSLPRRDESVSFADSTPAELARGKELGADARNRATSRLPAGTVLAAKGTAGAITTGKDRPTWPAPGAVNARS